MTKIETIIGPRVPAQELQRHALRYGAPGVLLMLARILILASLFLPYWRMELQAPQYPDGLTVTAYVNHLEGDVAEINGLNHYIGMKPLEDAAQFERANAVYMMIAVVLLVEFVGVVHRRWAVLLAAPAVLFPAFFLADLHYWLRSFGHNLDPAAPLSSAVKPFTPPVLGVGTVGQFHTVASPGIGLIVAAVAAVVIIVALFFHRRAYKPLVERAADRA